MEVVLLCAGRGSRLGNRSNIKPKAMTEIHTVPIVVNTINILKSLNITNIKIILGYQSHKFPKFRGVKKIINDEWETTNMVASYVKSINKNTFQDSVFIYGDIIFNKNILKNYILSIDRKVGSILIDQKWLDYWSMRFKNPLDDAETCFVNKQNYLEELGKEIVLGNIPLYQYIGLGYFPASYQKRIYEYWSSHLCYTKKGKNFYMTDMINKLISLKFNFLTHKIRGQWLEIDTESDLKIAHKLSKKINNNELSVLR